MTLAAFGRPSSWNWLLMFHLFSAFVLVAGFLVVATASVLALRSRGDASLLLRRIALRTNLMVVIPGFVGTHIFGMILGDREYPKGAKTPGWLDAAFGLTDLFGIVWIILLSLLQWWVLRRARKDKAGGWQAQVASWVPPLGLALLGAIVFVMAGKPGS